MMRSSRGTRENEEERWPVFLGVGEGKVGVMEMR